MIYTLGESLLDVIVENQNNTKIRPGGAMLNVAVSLARVRSEVALITELGNDRTGAFIRNFLETNNVRTDFLTRYPHTNTSLAMAFLDKDKKPHYTFYKSYPVERELISPDEFRKGDVLLFGSLYSLDMSIRNKLKEILDAAKKAGAILCYDPNIRHSHHFENESTKTAFWENLAMADVIKGSDEDFENIFGKQSLDGFHSMIKKLNTTAPLIITLGDKGVKVYAGKIDIQLEALPIDVVSTIGAGDAFNAGMVWAMTSLMGNTKKSLNFTEKELEFMLNSGLQFSASVCGSLDNYIQKSFIPNNE